MYKKTVSVGGQKGETMRLIDGDKLKGLVVRENTVTMKRLMSAIDRVEKEEAIPVSWLEDYAKSLYNGGHEPLANAIIDLIEDYYELPHKI